VQTIFWRAGSSIAAISHMIVHPRWNSAAFGLAQECSRSSPSRRGLSPKAIRFVEFRTCLAGRGNVKGRRFRRLVPVVGLYCRLCAR
jgi:hypothetical protein